LSPYLGVKPVVASALAALQEWHCFAFMQPENSCVSFSALRAGVRQRRRSASIGPVGKIEEGQQHPSITLFLPR
jgi:hypothetical protein